MLVRLLEASAALCAMVAVSTAARAADPPRLLQQPAISRDLIAFGYGGNIWTVPRAGGRATRLTTGVGIENAPLFSPDGRTIAFTGEYDGNIDVYTVPVTGGVPHRVTYHPSPDSAVAWSRDGKSLIFRSNRASASRYTQLYTVPADGGVATRLPLPMAYAGQMSPDGGAIAYSPLASAFGFGFDRYTAWGNYRGGMAGTVWITTLPGLKSTEVPHETASDFSPVYAGGKLYFLSARKGPVGVFSYDPATGALAEVYHNTGPDIRSLSTDGETLVFDRLGEIYTLVPGQQPQRVEAEVAGDLPDVRPRILNVADEVENVAVSPTGLRVAVEAHGEILTVPIKHGAVRNLTNSPGAAERQPAWSPDGQSVAYFSDADGLYALHVASQTGAQEGGPNAVRKFKLAPEPAYYFRPVWSPDSKKIAFRDNRLHTYVLDTVTGRLSTVGEPDVFGGFARSSDGVAWSPDSRWLAYAHSTASHMHVLMLWSATTGAVTQLTEPMADVRDPAFDRNGKYLYFLASNNAGAAQYGLDMSSDLYRPTSSAYAVSLAKGVLSPVAPESDDEKTAAEARAKAKEADDATPAGRQGDERAAARGKTAPKAPAPPAPMPVDLAALTPAEIAARVAALPLPPKAYRSLKTGKPGVLYFVTDSEAPDFDSEEPPAGSLSRWTLEDRKAEKLVDEVMDYQVSADGEKLLLALPPPPSPGGPDPSGKPPQPTYRVVAADKPVKDEDKTGEVKLDAVAVRVDPAAEWAQMYHEVWRIERAYFYDPAFHGVDTVAAEKRLEPYLAGVQSRSDLNYLFQEMLSAFSVGHLRGSGGAIPTPKKVPGGLLGADYVVQGGRWRIAKIYTGGSWSPDAKAPLAQPGLDLHEGDAILAVDGQPLSPDADIQQALEGTAGHAVELKIAPASGGAARDVTVIPVRSEAKLRYLDWVEGNRRRVSDLSGGRLAYVHLPDTGGEGFAAFNRYYFAQTDKHGAVVDERFNAGGQVANYVVEVLGRKLDSYWQPRYGAVEHSPAGAIYGPKVMISNESAGSGGDYLPWLFKHEKVGPVVGKRTWGGLVGIGDIPVLMDGGHVTSPSVGFFNPSGEWEVENHGVDPDYVVEQDPAQVAAGHDPQLEAAVALALDALKKSPPATVQRPAFPNYAKPGG